jgi:hypothetical protein
MKQFILKEEFDAKIQSLEQTIDILKEKSWHIQQGVVALVKDMIREANCCVSFPIFRSSQN